MAESFGTDAERYDRARPPYPRELIDRVVARSPGRAVLDVGTGTGIAARQLQAAGCSVLGVDPDARMADVARGHGVDVEVATFEAWDPAGRAFDAVVAAQSWHWVDPVAGAVKAADVLHAGGLLAVFGHVFEPPAPVAEAFATAFRRVAPDSPFANGPARRPVELYESLYAGIADAVRQTGRFAEPEAWRFDWRQDYTRDEWLEVLPTTGGLTILAPAATAEILDAAGAAVDAMGGGFTLEYVTLGTAATTLG